MDRRAALAGIGSLGFLACSPPQEELDDKLSAEVFLFLVVPTAQFPVIKKISYIDLNDAPYFDKSYFYTWITLDQLSKPGNVFKKVLLILQGKYYPETLIDALNIQLTPDDNIEFYRSSQGHIKARLLHVSGQPEIPQFSISKIS